MKKPNYRNLVPMGRIHVVPALDTAATRELFNMQPPKAAHDDAAAIKAAEDKRTRRAAKRAS